MWRNLTSIMPVAFVSLWASIMGFLTISANREVRGTPVTHDPVAYVAVTLLGGAVIGSLGFHQRRIQALEERLRDREKPTESFVAANGDAVT